MAERHQVRVTLEYAGDAQAFHQALKAALKVLYRTFKLRCVGLTELPPCRSRGQAPDPKPCPRENGDVTPFTDSR